MQKLKSFPLLFFLLFIVTGKSNNVEAASHLSTHATILDNGQLQVEVQLNDHPDFISYQMIFHYNSQLLTPVTVTNSVTGGQLLFNLNAEYNKQPCINFAFAAAESTTSTGTLFTILFERNATDSSDYDFSYESYEFFDSEGNAFAVHNSSVMTIPVPSICPEDSIVTETEIPLESPTPTIDTSSNTVPSTDSSSSPAPSEETLPSNPSADSGIPQQIIDTETTTVPSASSMPSDSETQNKQQINYVPLSIVIFLFALLILFFIKKRKHTL